MVATQQHQPEGGPWVATALLTVILALIIVMLAGCSAIPFLPEIPVGESVPDSEPSGAGPIATEAAMWWTGLATFAAGAFIFVAYLASWKFPLLASAPDGAGPAAMGAGFVVMKFADYMAAHPWVAALIVAGVVILMLIEMVDHQAWLRKWTKKGDT